MYVALEMTYLMQKCGCLGLKDEPTSQIKHPIDLGMGWEMGKSTDVIDSLFTS